MATVRSDGFNRVREIAGNSGKQKRKTQKGNEIIKRLVKGYSLPRCSESFGLQVKTKKIG